MRAAVQRADGTTLTGATHFLIRTNERGEPVVTDGVDGFMDEDGRFLTRYEAARKRWGPETPEHETLHTGDLPVGEEERAEEVTR